jgi:hypothetical protein
MHKEEYVTSSWLISAAFGLLREREVCSVMLGNYWRKEILYAIVLYCFEFEPNCPYFGGVESQSEFMCSLNIIFKVSVRTDLKAQKLKHEIRFFEK